MSDVSGDEVEGFDNAEFDAFQKNSKKRTRGGDDDDDVDQDVEAEKNEDDEFKDEEDEEGGDKKTTKQPSKKRKITSTKADKSHNGLNGTKENGSSSINGVNGIDQIEKMPEEPEMTFVQPAEVLADQEYDANMYAKTLNVKDFSNVLLGCCTTPGIECIVMTFAPKGMQLYAKPKDSPTCVTAYFNKEMFSEYKVNKTTQRIIEKGRLDYLKKKISKEVTFLEITSWQENPGFTFSGYRTYKTGGKCKFTVNTADIVADIRIMNMSAYTWQWTVRTSSEKFKNNVDFIDDSNEFIKMTISSNCIEFQGIRESGQVGESIDQETESKISEKFQALFHKKHLKIITATKDLNKDLTIAFNIPNPEDPKRFPVHFAYELDTADPQSHFSAYLLPMGDDAD